MWPLRLEEELLLRGLKRAPAAMKLMSLWSLRNETNTRRCGHWAPLESRQVRRLMREAAARMYVHRYGDDTRRVPRDLFCGKKSNCSV